MRHRAFILPLVALGLLAAAPLLQAVDPVRVIPPNDHFVQPESTRRMGALIRKIYQDGDPLQNPFRADQIPLLRDALAKATDPGKHFELHMKLAATLLQSGNPAAALTEYVAIREFLRSNAQDPGPRLETLLLTNEAMCYLRAGEDANCLLNHNGDSCIFPIRGGGVHQLKDGSTGAVRVLTELLTKYPRDLRARWLINIAYMTLGGYPDEVPAKWLIPPEKFASEYPLPHFPDVAASVGLDVDALAGGVVMDDFDRDGFLDLMISSWGFTEKDQIRLFRSNGDGTFTERSKEAGLAGLYGGLNLIQGDFNNDSYPDVLVLRGAWLRGDGHYPLSLLRNNGDFTFTDVTEQAGMMHYKPTQAAVWFDYNGDGLLDIFVGNESIGDDANTCELYRNNGNGTFTECAAGNGVAIVGFVKAVASADYNNDGRPDLFLSTREGAKWLFRNDGPAKPGGGPAGPWRFTNVTEEAGITAPANSFPCWFWDYDNDGWPDLMLTGFGFQDVGDMVPDYLGLPHPAQKAKLYHNNHDGTFTDVSKAAGVSRLLHAMSANFGDLDNDGWLDFYLGTGDPDLATLMPNRMFRNDGGRRFQDVTTAGGFGQLQKGHGIAFGDIDNDGDQDVYSVVGGAFAADHYPHQLFANPGNSNHWLKLILGGVRSNRLAIGARVKVVVNDAGTERAIYRTVGSGASFGANPLRQEIGVGAATTVERVEVFWPVTGETQVFTGLEVDHTYALTEGAAAAQPVALKSFALPTSSAPGGHHHHQP